MINNHTEFYQSSGSNNLQKILIPIVALSVWIGTGGSQSLPSIPSAGSGQAVHFKNAVYSNTQEEALFARKVFEVKNFFGLNTTELSRIFHVGRPTIYSWINDEVMPKKDHSARVNSIYQVFKEFRHHSISNMVDVKNHFHTDAGKSLTELLEAKKPDIEKISILMSKIEDFSKSYEDKKIKLSHLNKLPENVRKTNLEYLM